MKVVGVTHWLRWIEVSGSLRCILSVRRNVSAAKRIYFHRALKKSGQIYSVETLVFSFPFNPFFFFLFSGLSNDRTSCLEGTWLGSIVYDQSIQVSLCYWTRVLMFLYDSLKNHEIVHFWTSRVRVWVLNYSVDILVVHPNFIAFVF